jgi:hypothetical protein
MDMLKQVGTRSQNDRRDSASAGGHMPKIVNFFMPRVLELMKQIEAENDEEVLAQLFLELKLALNQNNRKVRLSKKSPRSATTEDSRRA